jgi:uncharacterized Zn finger protein
MSTPWTRNWWGAAWVEKMERLAERTRFAGGEQYVRSGRVQTLRFDGRAITARVEAPEEPAYHVRIFFDPFSREQWGLLLAQVRDRAALGASILSGDLPLEMQTAFSKAKLRFMPERYADLHLECACPDWLKPCKHQVAVWLAFAREFDRQPFLLFELRGLKRPELLGLLQDSPASAVAEPTAGEEIFPEITIPPKPEALPADPEVFWSAPELPAARAEPPGRLLLDDSIFDRLKDWPGVESEFHQIYDDVYELVTLIRS